MKTSLFTNFKSDCLDYDQEFLSAVKADRLLKTFWADLNWKQEPIQLFGKRMNQPRLTAWYGDPHAVYEYSGLIMNPQPWHSDLYELNCKLASQLGLTFNSVLANAYRDGKDSMGWHADDEPELGVRPTIASVSLGAERRFLLRPRSGGRSFSMELGHGSLLTMKDECQSIYQHSLPKTSRNTGLRINLTFRNVSPRPGCV